ncbi:KxDL motif-containing protein 1, partial [Stegodyphus mimosarum]
MLVNCNALLSSRYVGASKDLKKHITLLVDLKKDLDSVFRRIRFLKMKLSQQYPESFSACSSVFNILDEEEEQDEKENTSAYNLQAPDISTTVASSSGSRGSSPTSASSS